MRGCSRGGMRGCSAGHAWLLRGGMRGCSWGVCMVAPGGGACMVFAGGMCVVFARGCVWFFPGGACMVFPQGGHAWFFLGGLRRIRRDMVNERAVRILLECILVLQNFCRKLHENERILTERGRVRIPGTPLDLPLAF